jgi:mono/diheme cytochrome c family protein
MSAMSAAHSGATATQADYSGARPAPPRRPRRRWRNLLLIVLLLAVLFAIAAVWGNRPHVPQREPQTVHRSPQQLAQGLYLARAADCMACHDGAGSGLGSLPFAGGKPLPTPFGTLYGTNISPDPDHGIGRWTAEEFHAAVTRGTAPGGRQLYPAMPYASYHLMSREDSDLIYGYLMNQQPVAQPNRKPDLPFPFNLRVLMFGWKTMFLSSAPLPVGSQGQSPAWLRGQYLGNVMGHCAECHTPRGMFGQMDKGRWLQGGTLSLFSAPSITAEALAARGWTPEGMAQFLHSGFSAHGSAFDEMHEVIANSTQYLTREDLDALSAFLLGDTPPAAAVLPTATTAPATDTGTLDAGRSHYMALCAGCHGSEGLGRSLTMPPLRGNSTVRQADARNLVLAILVGLPRHPQGSAGPTPLPGMPGFLQELDDAGVAALANYTRTSLGGQPADVTAAQVADLRAAAAKAGHSPAP